MIRLILVVLVSVSSTFAEVKVAIAQGYVNLAPYIVDDFKKAYERAGIAASFEVVPGARALSLANDGRFQGLDARFKGTSAIGNLVPVNVEIYLLSKSYVWGKPDGATYGSLDELKTVNMVGARGSAFNRDLEAAGYRIHLVDDEATAIKMVQSGRAEVALFGDFVFSQLKAAGLTGDIEPVSQVLDEQWLYHHVHKSNADLVPKLEKAISELKAEGLFKLR